MQHGISEPDAGDLPALEAIRRLKAAYCRFVDTKQWERLEALFTPDASLDGFGSVPDGADPATFVAAVAKTLARAVSTHHVHAPEIVLDGPDSARAIWPMMDHVDFPPGESAGGRPRRRGWLGRGWYEERYVRVDGAWLIAHMRLVRQRMDELPADHPVPEAGRHAPRPDWI